MSTTAIGFSPSSDFDLLGSLLFWKDYFNIDSKNKLNIFYKYVGKIPVFLLDEENIVESYIGAYSLLDISINRRINEVFILSLGGKNLLNITNITQINNTDAIHSYSNNSLAVSYGRTFFLSLKLNL